MLLKELRENKNLSQKELAEKVGISIKTIQAYEQNILDLKNASVKTIKALSEVLEYDLYSKITQ